MHNKEEITLQFDAYLRDELDAAQKIELETSMKQNKALKEAFVEYKSFTEQLENAFLKEELAKLHTEIKPKKGVVKRLYPLLGTAAAIVILAMVYTYFQADHKDRLYANFFVVDVGLPTVMGGVDKSYQFNDAMVDYKLAQYELAIEKWEVLLNYKPQNDTLNYYIGVSYLNLDAFEQATSFLKKEPVLNSPRFQNKANFYLGLIALKKGNKDEAQNLLKLADTPNSRAVLKELE